MGQLNSGIATKSCSFDFTENGALGSGVYTFSGIGMKPGEAVIDIRVTRQLNLTSGSGGATIFSFGLGTPAPVPSAFIPLFSDTLNNINGYAWNLWQSPSVNRAFKDNFNWRVPATNDESFGLYFTSNAALTAGRVDFVVSYLLTKY